VGLAPYHHLCHGDHISDGFSWKSLNQRCAKRTREKIITAFETANLTAYYRTRGDYAGGHLFESPAQ